MSSVNMSAAPSDLTARARIRDAAIRRFATQGLGASLRSIAGEAGVSAALILHHFGSRAGLRQACDEHVRDLVRNEKGAVLRSGGAAVLLTQLAQVDGYAPVVAYVLRVLQTGEPLAHELFEGMVQDTLAYLEEGVTAGTVRQSRDPEGRARWLVSCSVGPALLHLRPTGDGELDVDALPQWLESYLAAVTLPMLELYTEPLLTDSSLLEAYLAYRDTNPEETP